MWSPEHQLKMNPVSWLLLTWVGAGAGWLQPALACSFVAGCACDDCGHHDDGVKCAGRAPLLTVHRSLWNKWENLETLGGLMAVQQHPSSLARRTLPSSSQCASPCAPQLPSTLVAGYAIAGGGIQGHWLTDCWKIINPPLRPSSSLLLVDVGGDDTASFRGPFWNHKGFLCKNFKTPECFVVIALLATRK